MQKQRTGDLEGAIIEYRQFLADSHRILVPSQQTCFQCKWALNEDEFGAAVEHFVFRFANDTFAKELLHFGMIAGTATALSIPSPAATQAEVVLFSEV
jgi:hypothetical protein